MRWAFMNSRVLRPKNKHLNKFGRQVEDSDKFLAARPQEFCPVEILCNSCAAFSVCSAIFPLPCAAAFVDNQASSVIDAKVL